MIACLRVRIVTGRMVCGQSEAQDDVKALEEEGLISSHERSDSKGSPASLVGGFRVRRI